MKKFLLKHPLIQKTKINQFWIDESVAHYQVLIFDNHEIFITTNAPKKNYKDFPPTIDSMKKMNSENESPA